MVRSALVAFGLGSLFMFGANAVAGELLVGAASADITPDKPVALDGQMGLRVSKKVETPITANVLALESREGERSLDSAVMISCDLVLVSEELEAKTRQAIQKRLPDFDQKKLFFNATHTHTAPVTRSGVYEIPSDAMQPDAYCDFAAERIADAMAKAWKERTPGSVTWGLGHAAVAVNRRAVYADGHATMYGNTDTPDFRGLEGYVDHDVNSLFFWNREGTLIAIAVNVACPSQEVERFSNLNADFWHPVRESLRKRHGQGVCVLGWTGAAGDQSPHRMLGFGPPDFADPAEDRMIQLRKMTWPEELARRIVAAVDEAFEVVKNDRHSDVPLIHKTVTLSLPARLVTDAEYKQMKDFLETKHPQQMMKRWYEEVIRRYEAQKENPKPVCDIETHVIRIGDAVICTNPFELFTDYGTQIKARSKAVQTLIVQLAGGPASYLPTKRAVEGGGYSAIIQSNQVGPEGGQVLVDQTAGLIESCFPAKK